MKNSTSHINERRKEIFDYIKGKENVNVDDISHIFQISSVTARKDLDVLANDGLIIRTHGGAKLAETPKEAPSSQSQTNSILPEEDSEIERLARTAASFIEDNDVILINSNRDAAHVIQHITAANITIITNSLPILNEPHGKNVSIILTGGQVQENHDGLAGAFTLESLMNITANKCILGIDGIAADSGISFNSLDNSYISRKMIEQTDGQIIVLSTPDQIGKKCRFLCAQITDISVIVSGKSASEEEIHRCSVKGARTILV